MTEEAPQLLALEVVLELRPEDLAVLASIAADQTDVPSVDWILAQWRAHRMMIWRTGSALVLTERVTDAVSSTLFVRAAAGRDMIARIDLVASDLRMIAKTLRCSAVGSNVERPGMKMLFERIGGKFRWAYYELEVE